MYLGKNINYLRREAKISGENLGKLLDKGKAAISSYEQGNSLPPLNVLIQICEYFKVDLNSIIYKKLYEGETINNQLDSKELEMLKKRNLELEKENLELYRKYTALLEKDKGVDKTIKGVEAK